MTAQAAIEQICPQAAAAQVFVGQTCPKTAQAAVGQKRPEAAYKTIPGIGQGLVSVCFGFFQLVSV